MGRSTVDTTIARVINEKLSYGIGTLIPLGSALDLFAEWRKRMSKLVLPRRDRSRPARMEFRFSMSYRLASRQ